MFHVGDIVLVIGTDIDVGQPKAGAIGTVTAACICMRAMVGLVGYSVSFSGSRRFCYFRRQLRKIEPPTDTDTDVEKTDRTATA